MIRSALAAALGALLLPQAIAQSNVARFDFGTGTRSAAEVTSIFGRLPTHGFAPMRVRLRNDTAEDRDWTFRFSVNTNSGDSFGSTFTLAAAKQAETVHDIVVPLPTQFERSSGRSYNSSYLTVEVNAPPFGDRRDNYGSDAPSKWPAIALSTAIKEKNLLSLDDTIEKKRSIDSFGSGFNPADLPADWRAYSGLDFLLISSEEWVALAPGARTAIADWVKLGGDLHLYASNAATTLESLGLSGGTGLGGVLRLEWDGSNLDTDRTIDLYADLAKPGNKKNAQFSESYGAAWELANALGTRSFGSWQVAIILVIFGVLVGPVNLFVLAKPGQRHRLFITTPIISVGTSLVLIALILFQDGTGGKGRRFAFIELSTADRKTYHLQEQTARTGVIFRSEFRFDEPTFITPVITPPSAWSSISAAYGRPPVAYSGNGDSRGGDWFQSRKEQAHYLESVRSTRARVELVPDGGTPTPTVVSSIEFPLDALYYQLEDGTYYRSTGPVRTGEKAPLESISKGAYEQALTEACSLASPDLRERLVPHCDAPGTFFATASSPDPMIATLASISWNDDRSLIHGPVAPAP